MEVMYLIHQQIDFFTGGLTALLCSEIQRETLREVIAV